VAAGEATVGPTAKGEMRLNKASSSPHLLTLGRLTESKEVE
jgi:hypothetical protein